MANSDAPPPDPTTAVTGCVPTEVEFLPEHITAYGLTLASLDRQQIHDRIQIGANMIGVIVDGCETYLDTYKHGEFEIPSTYSQWDNEFGDLVLGSQNPRRVCTGAIGRHQTEPDTYVQVCFASDLVRAAVRIVTGGGRFTVDDLVLHSAVPFAVLETTDVAVAIAPLFREIDAATVSTTPHFSYETVNGRVRTIRCDT